MLALFCRYGMVLQQCAHFYNNIATEMIPCQKPMMLAEAVEFEKVGFSSRPPHCKWTVYLTDVTLAAHASSGLCTDTAWRLHAAGPSHACLGL